MAHPDRQPNTATIPLAVAIDAISRIPQPMQLLLGSVIRAKTDWSSTDGDSKNEQDTAASQVNIPLSLARIIYQATDWETGTGLAK